MSDKDYQLTFLEEQSTERLNDIRGAWCSGDCTHVMKENDIPNDDYNRDYDDDDNCGVDDDDCDNYFIQLITITHIPFPGHPIEER